MTFDFKNSFHSELSLALKNQNHSYLCKIQHEMNNQNTRHIIQQHHQSFNPFSVLHSNTFFSPMMISPPKFIQNSHSVLLPVSHFSKSDTLSKKPKFDQSLNFCVRFAVNGISKFTKGNIVPLSNRSIQAGDFGDDAAMIAENSKCIVIGKNLSQFEKQRNRSNLNCYRSS